MASGGWFGKLFGGTQEVKTPAAPTQTEQTKQAEMGAEAVSDDTRFKKRGKGSLYISSGNSGGGSGTGLNL